MKFAGGAAWVRRGCASTRPPAGVWNPFGVHGAGLYPGGVASSSRGSGQRTPGSPTPHPRRTHAAPRAVGSCTRAPPGEPYARSEYDVLTAFSAWQNVAQFFPSGNPALPFLRLKGDGMSRPATSVSAQLTTAPTPEMSMGDLLLRTFADMHADEVSSQHVVVCSGQSGGCSGYGSGSLFALLAHPGESARSAELAGLDLSGGAECRQGSAAPRALTPGQTASWEPRRCPLIEAAPPTKTLENQEAACSSYAQAAALH